MSKKILKGSLALGALMAFVITGSAWATDTSWDTKELTKLEGKPVGTCNYDDVKGEYYMNRALKHGYEEDKNVGENNEGDTDKFLHSDLNGYTLHIESEYAALGDIGNAYCTKGFKIIDSSEEKNSKLILESTKTDNGTLMGFGVIDVGTLKIVSGHGYAIQPSRNGIMDINANEVTLIGEDSEQAVINASVAYDENGQNAYTGVIFGKKDENGEIIRRIGVMTIDDSKAKDPIRVGLNSYVNIYAEKLDITRSEVKPIRPTDNGTIEIDALSGSIDSDFEIGEKGTSKGTLNMTLGSGATWKGKIITDVGSSSVSKIVLDGATWELSGKSDLTDVTFNAGSKLVINGNDFTYVKDGENTYALNGVGDAKLKVVDEAQIQVTNIKNVTYNIATGFKTIEANNYWDVLDLTNVMQATWDKAENDDLKLVISAKGADAMEDSVAPEGSGEMVSEIITSIGNVDNISELPEETQAAAGFIQSAVEGNDAATAKNIISNALQMAEAGGNSGTAVTVANNVSSVTTGRMGFSATPSAQKGGNGVGLLAEDSGAAIWAQYVHGKDSVEDMPMSGGATSYEGQFNGVVMGVDFKKVGKFQSGVAFNYGEGDTNSVGNRISTHSDYDFWGVGYYGNIRNDDTNFIFDVNYAKSESDVEQDNGGTTLEASPETTTWSAGVKVEKLYQNNNVQIVPYTGLRFMSVDTDSYKATNGTDTLFNYAPERQDIWLLPLGVSIKQEVTNANGWTVTPKVDLSYIWAFGDTDSEMTVAIPGVSSTSRLGYTVMDDESWLGVVGLEAAKGDWTFGVSYSYQKGDHSENEKWYVDAKYSF